MREVFVAVLCCVGLFLIAYKGYSRLDNIASNIAGTAVIVVAMFPTNFMCHIDCQKCVGAIFDIEYHNTIHFIAATIFFTVLAFISIFLFTKTGSGATPSPKKIIRNRIFKICGYGIIICLLVITYYDFIFVQEGKEDNSFVLVFESFMLFFFGTSWLVKGEMFWGD